MSPSFSDGRKRDYGNGQVRRHGQSWQGRFWYEDERIHVNLGSLGGLTEAQARKRLRSYIESYEPTAPGEKLTFDALCSKFEVHKEAENLTRNSLEAIRSAIRVHLRPEFGPRLAESLTAEDLDRFKNKKLRNAAPKSVKNWMSVLHSILEYGVTPLRVLRTNVAKDVSRVKAPKKKTDLVVLSTGELRVVRESFPNTPIGRSDSTMVLVASRSGLRQGELISLRWRNVDWDNGWIRVATSYERLSKEHKAPKNYKPRGLPLSDEVKMALLEHFKRSRFNRDNDLVFPHPDTGHELDGSRLNRRFKAAVIQSGVRDTENENRIYKTSRGEKTERTYTPVTWHDLRHAFGTFCAEAMIPPAVIEDWCGWADAETMKIYLHFAPAGFELGLLNKAIAQDDARSRSDGRNFDRNSDQSRTDRVES